VLVAAVFIGVGLLALIPVVANPKSEPREIVLVTRDMAFYVEGSSTPNPTLVLRPGEEVTVVVKNQEPGITHGFGVSALNVSVDRIQPGVTRAMRLRAPAVPGEYEYVCPPHAQMMRGKLVVED
jgi:heme/copper-type cytochrome/quinol oxidase subunit 2